MTLLRGLYWTIYYGVILFYYIWQNKLDIEHIPVKNFDIKFSGIISHNNSEFMHIFISVYTYTFLSITCTVCTMLIIRMFLKLTIWYWITSWCVLLWRRLFLSFSASLAACHSFRRAETLGLTPVCFCISPVVVPVLLMFRHHL